MAAKSIILAETKLVNHLPAVKMLGNDAHPEDIVFSINFELKENVREWCMSTFGYCKFNTRKGRIKFINESDASFFKLTWL